MDTTDTTPTHRSTVKGFFLTYSDRRRRRLSRYQINGTASWVGLWFTILSLKNWKMRSGYVSYYWYWYSAPWAWNSFRVRERKNSNYIFPGWKYYPLASLNLALPAAIRQDIKYICSCDRKVDRRCVWRFNILGLPPFVKRGRPALWLDTSQYSKAGRLLLVCNEFMTWFQSWECQAVLNLKLKH